MAVFGRGSFGSGLHIEMSVQFVNELLRKMLWEREEGEGEGEARLLEPAQENELEASFIPRLAFNLGMKSSASLIPRPAGAWYGAQGRGYLFLLPELLPKVLQSLHGLQLSLQSRHCRKRGRPCHQASLAHPHTHIQG